MRKINRLAKRIKNLNEEEYDILIGRLGLKRSIPGYLTLAKSLQKGNPGKDITIEAESSLIGVDLSIPAEFQSSDYNRTYRIQKIEIIARPYVREGTSLIPSQIIKTIPKGTNLQLIK